MKSIADAECILGVVRESLAEVDIALKLDYGRRRSCLISNADAEKLWLRMSMMD